MLVCSPSPAQAPQEGAAPAPELIAPAFRAATHFADGEAYLRALPEGTRIEIHRPDGGSFTLALTQGKLNTTLPKASLSEDSRRFTSPFGYSIYAADQPGWVLVEARSGARTQLWGFGTVLRGVQSNGGHFETRAEKLALRLPDATRIDLLDQGRRWEAITIHGQRYEFDPTTGAWSELAPLPSPPLIPDPTSFYVSGSGAQWRRPVFEAHVVFAWNWWGAGLTVDRAIDDVRGGFRRKDLDEYFNLLDSRQPAPDMGACLLARRLALPGGTRVVFDAPGREPETAFILPGPIEPDGIELKSQGPVTITPRGTK